jgi:DNA-3-methyladenine glycosylase I
MLILEGAQAGLSWLTILRKREHYREAFHGFDADRIARYGASDVARLLSNPGIVRNRLKIEAAVANARSYLKLVETFGSFDGFLWRYVENRPIQNAWRSISEIPARTEISDRMSKDLKARGFKFAGSTICYALMQTVGMVNDHLVTCFRYQEVKQIAR